jgi:putative transposase
MGIKKISRQTVRNILKEEGISPGPDRTSDSWNQFIDRHKETLWACDFFSVKTVTKRGLQEMYVLAWLCMSSREVIVSTSTEHPNSAWVVEQTIKLVCLNKFIIFGKRHLDHLPSVRKEPDFVEIS